MNNQSGTREIDLPLNDYFKKEQVNCFKCRGLGFSIDDGVRCVYCYSKGYIVEKVLVKLSNLELESNEA